MKMTYKDGMMGESMFKVKAVQYLSVSVMSQKEQNQWVFCFAVFLT